MNKSIRQTVV